LHQTARREGAASPPIKEESDAGKQLQEEEESDLDDEEDFENDGDEEEETAEGAKNVLFIDAAQLGHIVEVQRMLQHNDVDVNARELEENNTALILAAQNGRPMVVGALIGAGADVNAANKNGDTPLILASLNGHGAVVDALLKAGADVHATDLEFGSCALFYASRQGHCGLVDALLKAGADVNGSRVTALLIAARFGHASAVHKLLEAGACVDSVDSEGNTALHRCAMETTPGAVYGGLTGEVVEALVKSCASLDVKNNDGVTASDMAHKGIGQGSSEWQKMRCREMLAVLEPAAQMTVSLRTWLKEVGLANQWREFARLGAKEREDIEMLERDDVRRDRGSSLTPIEANRLFRAMAHPECKDMGANFECFLRTHRLEDYASHFRMLGVAFERDLLDITDTQLTLMVERHGLRILDRRRFDKAVVGLRRRLLDCPRDEDQGSAERPPVRIKKEDGAMRAPNGIIKNVTFGTDRTRS